MNWRSHSEFSRRGLLAGAAIALVVVAAIGGALFLTPIPKKVCRRLLQMMGEPVSREVIIREVEGDPEVIREVVIKEIIKEIQVREPLPSAFVNYKRVDTAQLWKGIDVLSELEVVEGRAASVERDNRKGYTFDFKIKLTVPKAISTMQELSASNEHLAKMLPGLAQMVEAGKVSGFYHKIYEIKTKRVQQLITRLSMIPDRHNFYDCETILELVHPQSKQKVFFLQGDMDVVSDGSDGDRMPEYDEYIAKSNYYQPFTSYGWAKRTSQPNPLLGRWEKKFAEAKKELADGKVRRSQRSAHKAKIKLLKREIDDLKGRSFLIARADPFIVVPTWMARFGKQSAFAPKVGDYAAVVFGDRVFPAIVGDTGPTWKVGEASLRLAKEINPKASPYSRPVSELHVSYLIFPGSREEKKSAPDLDKWYSEVEKFLGKIGGLGEGYQLHRWEDHFATPAEGDAESKAEGS